jgi:hypothetical protein
MTKPTVEVYNATPPEIIHHEFINKHLRYRVPFIPENPFHIMERQKFRSGPVKAKMEKAKKAINDVIRAGNVDEIMKGVALEAVQHHEFPWNLKIKWLYLAKFGNRSHVAKVVDIFASEKIKARVKGFQDLMREKGLIKIVRRI